MQYTSNELLADLRRVASIVDRSPYERDMLEHGNYAYSTYFDYFESWTRAKELAGVESQTTNRISDDALLGEVERVDRLVHGSPTRRDMDEYGSYPSSTYKYRFGSWNDCLEAVGLPLNHQPPGDGAGRLLYGPEWTAYRERALRRDEYRCRICWTPDSEVEPSLHVHHITPLRTFGDSPEEIDFEEAHALDNLVSLCPRCHRTTEGLYPSCEVQTFAVRARKHVLNQSNSEVF